MRRPKQRKLVTIVFLIIGVHSYAQLTDIARIEYSFIPKSNSEDQYTRLRALLNYPIKVKDKSYLVLGGEYNRILLNLEDDYPFDTSSIDKLHIIDLNIGYTFKASEHWRIGFKFNPRIASTLTNTLTMNDVFLNGGAFFIKDRTGAKDIPRPYRLVLGLTYNTTVGLPFPLPFISYYRKINNRWSFSAGIPKSNLKYAFNNRNSLQAFAALDGYFANIQRPIEINNQSVDNISLSVAVGGLGYEYFFTEHLVVYVYSGYTFRLNNVLRDSNREEIFKLDDLNAFYLRTGLKFKI